MSEKLEEPIKTLARYEPAAVYIGTGEYVAECVSADDGDYYLAADVDAAIEALQAEIERLREQLRLATVDQAAAEAEANDARAEAEALRAEVAEWKRVAAAQAELHDEAEERAQRLAEALRGWWEAHRPVGWTEDKHRSCPHVNLATDAEKALATALLRHQEATCCVSLADWQRWAASFSFAMTASNATNAGTLTTAPPRQHRRAAMRRRNGWCIWSPWSGYLSSTFACTRTECIKLFERDNHSPWRRYREQGFECRPVLFVYARNESGNA